MIASPIYSSKLTIRIFASGAIGNILETYDLILISLMAATLSKTFFPPTQNSYTQIVNILYVFLIGLLVRPLGNIIMGVLADHYGRKKLMIFSLIFTGVGTMLIGILPSYSDIGILSTILFIILRIAQNFFAGIEYINSATYLIESSSPDTRGYYASWTAIGISGGYLLASLTVLAIYTLTSSGYLPTWTWRLIFIFSIVGILFGFWIRKSIPESLIFIIDNSHPEKRKKRDIWMNSINYIIQNPTQCLAISGLTLMGVSLTYIYYLYIPINMINSRHFSPIAVYGLNASNLLIIVLLIPFFGKISDYINKITLLKITCGLVILLALPFFWLCSYGTYIEIILITVLISIPSSCFFSLYPFMITDFFPTKIRCTTASLIYQLIVSIEMGFLPLLTTYLLEMTNIPYIPGFLLILATLVGFLGLVYFKDNAINTNNKSQIIK